MNLKRLVLAIGLSSVLLLGAAALRSSSRVGAASTNTVFLPLVSRPVPSLAVGYQFAWNGNGYIRGSEYYDIGYHETIELDQMEDPDTIRASCYAWYDPNPLALNDERWNSYLSVSTGYQKSTTYIDDPSLKWSYPLILPFDWRWQNGQMVTIGGQAFVVSGPISGYTAFGRAFQYWKLTNRDKFLYGDWGDWKQYVNPGEAILEYDAGTSQLNTRSNILRREYYKESPTLTVQYIMQLTGASSLSASSIAGFNQPPKLPRDSPTTSVREREGNPAGW